MKVRALLLAAGIVLSLGAIVLIMVKGGPADRVSLDALAEIGEGALHSVIKAGRLLTEMSDEEEMAIGNAMHQKIFAADEANMRGTPIKAYVADVGRRVAENVNRKGIAYTFHVIESVEPDGSALPGGHVYVTIGLLAVLKSEAELAAVLGHEIAHIDARHSIGVIQHRVAAEKMTGIKLDLLADIGSSMLIRPAYSEVQENEADAAGTYLMYKAGYHPLAVVAAFERIAADELKRGYPDMSATPVGDTVQAAAGLIGRYFSTHPGALDRIDKVKKYVADNKLLGDNLTFYIGQRNFREHVSYATQRYKEEWQKDYHIEEPDEARKEAKAETSAPPTTAVTAPASPEDATPLDEVYTKHGRVARGMTVTYLKTFLPETARVFEYDDRIGYKDIEIYDLQEKGRKIVRRVSLWIELADRKVAGIRVVAE